MPRTPARPSALLNSASRLLGMRPRSRPGPPPVRLPVPRHRQLRGQQGDARRAVPRPLQRPGPALRRHRHRAARRRVGRRLHPGRAHVSLRTILSWSLGLFAATSVLFWCLSRFHDAAVDACRSSTSGSACSACSAPAQVWTLANFVLTTREAKRLVRLDRQRRHPGRSSAGSLIALTVARFGTEACCSAWRVALFGCRARRTRSGGSGTSRRWPTTTTRARDLAPRRPPACARRCGSSRARRYLKAIAAVICLSSFATTVDAWQFKAIAKAAIPDTRRAGDVLRHLQHGAGLVSLALQLLLTAGCCGGSASA